MSMEELNGAAAAGTPPNSGSGVPGASHDAGAAGADSGSTSAPAAGPDSSAADSADSAPAAAANPDATQADAPASAGESGADDAASAAAEQLAADPLTEALETVAKLEAEAKQHNADLYNLQREYNGYVKRSKSQQSEARLHCINKVLEALLPVLDSVELARQHGDLDDGAVSLIAENLENTLFSNFKLERFGAAGDPFDPAIHEALMHRTSPDATEESVEVVVQPGYKVDGKVLRAARVGVVSPEE